MKYHEKYKKLYIINLTCNKNIYNIQNTTSSAPTIENSKENTKVLVIHFNDVLIFEYDFIGKYTLNSHTFKCAHELCYYL